MNNLAEIFNTLSEEQIKRIFDPLTLISLKDKINNHAYIALGIKAGAVSEAIIKSILCSYGATILTSKQVSYDIDAYFEYNDYKYFIEAKIRDDHDSTKKRGQIENYIAKKENFPVNKSCCWFIDKHYKKNKKFYSEQISNTELYYADEIINWLVSIFGDCAKNFYHDFIALFKVAKQNEINSLKNDDYFQNSLDINVIDYKILTYIFYYGDYNEIKETLFNNNIPVQVILDEYKKRHIVKRDKVKYVLTLLEGHKND